MWAVCVEFEEFEKLKDVGSSVTVTDGYGAMSIWTMEMTNIPPMIGFFFSQLGFSMISISKAYYSDKLVSRMVNMNELGSFLCV
jgi:NAD/NADP transhydrogenase beta subunit